MAQAGQGRRSPSGRVPSEVVDRMVRQLETDWYIRVQPRSRTQGKYNCTKCGHLPTTHVLHAVENTENMLSLGKCRVPECGCAQFRRAPLLP